MWIALIALPALLIVLVAGALGSQAAVAWTGAGLVALGAVLCVVGIFWPVSDEHFDALDESLSGDTPFLFMVLGGFLAAVGAVVALVGVIPW